MREGDPRKGNPKKRSGKHGEGVKDKRCHAPDSFASRRDGPGKAKSRTADEEHSHPQTVASRPRKAPGKRHVPSTEYDDCPDANGSDQADAESSANSDCNRPRLIPLHALITRPLSGVVGNRCTLGLHGHLPWITAYQHTCTRTRGGSFEASKSHGIADASRAGSRRGSRLGCRRNARANPYPTVGIGVGCVSRY